MSSKKTSKTIPKQNISNTRYVVFIRNEGKETNSKGISGFYHGCYSNINDLTDGILYHIDHDYIDGYEISILDLVTKKWLNPTLDSEIKLVWSETTKNEEN